MSNENTFWDFTLAAYPTEGVQYSVIHLQNHCDADVNILFYCCWMGSRSRLLSVENLAMADDAVNAWREHVIKPLRVIRDKIKDEDVLSAPEGAMDVRGNILGAEVDSERIAQGILDSLLPTNKVTNDMEAHQLAAHNLRHYFKNLSHDIDGKNRECVSTLLQGVFPEASNEQIESALTN